MNSSHLHDVELVLSVDGELSPSHAARVRAHLSTCELCCARRDEFATAASSVTVRATEALEENLDAALRPAAVSRAQLRARMAEAAANERSRAWWKLPLPALLQSAAVLCGIFLLGAATAKWIVPAPLTTAEAPVAYDADAEPDHSLTPGAVRNVSLSEVCAMPHEEVEVDVPASLRSAVFREYGLGGAHAADYEIDYLIAPGLGGSEDIQNLWPEPYSADVWNARVKDSLEEYLHQSVCSGKLDLRTAQSDISHDWIAAYKKYFQTDKPLPDSSTRTASTNLATKPRSFVPGFLAFVDLRTSR